LERIAAIFAGSAMEHAEATRRFYKFVWPLRPTALRTARFLCHDATEADDLAQETLMKAFKAMDSFTPGTNPSGWIMAILRNTWIDRLRAGNRAASNVAIDDADWNLEAPAQLPGAVDPHDPLALLERLSDQDLINELKKLPDEIRWTLLLVDVEQMDYQDAAIVLDVPLGTVKSRASRGHRMLRDALTNVPMTRPAKPAKLIADDPAKYGVKK
jgi:RNA polymerase sigma-70 factor (ECF subfamily)